MKSYLKSTSLAVMIAASVAVAPYFVSPVTAKEPVDTAKMVEEINIPFEVIKLDNGFTAIVHSDHAVPTVYVGMWYGVGSKEEPKGKSGFAHLFEHLMFQGSENREGEYFTPFTKAGATGMNGTTSNDRTNYYATVPTGALDMALWMESDRMSHLLGAIDQAALDEQRDVVKNEKRNGENRPYAKSFDLMRQGLYPPEHPYYHSTIGSMEDLESASLDDVKNWFRKYYGASNAYLVLAGDVTVEQAREKIQKYFGDAPVGEPLTKKSRWVPELASDKVEHMYDNVPQTRLSRTWNTPPRGERDEVLLGFVVDTLVGNKNAPLRKILVDELQLATNASGSTYGQTLSGIFSLSIALRPGVDRQQVEEIVQRELDKFIAEGPDPDLFANAKLASNIAVISALESKSAIGRALVEGQLYHNDPAYYKKALAWENEATVEDVRKVAERWLSKPSYQLTVEPFPQYSSATEGADRSKIPEVGEPTGVTFPDIVETTLKNGAKLVLAKQGSLPLVDVNIEFNTGNHAERADNIGAASAAFSLLRAGTKKYSDSELASELDKIGMQPNIQSGGAQSSFSFRVLTPYLEQGFELAAEMLQKPTYPSGEVDKLKKSWDVALTGVEKNPTQNARSYFTKAIYPDGSPLSYMLNKDVLAKMDSTTLKAFHQQEITPENMTIYMIGDLDLKKATKIVEKNFGKWKSKGSSQLQAVGKALPSKPRVILVNQQGAVQSTILAGHALPAFNAKDNTRLAVMNDIFGGGFEGRINMNLREDKGWSYGSFSRLQPNATGDQSIIVSATVQKDKTKESMMEILKEYRDFVSTRPAMDTELNRVVNKRVRSLPGNYARQASFLGAISWAKQYGLPYDYAEGSADRVKALTLDEINAKAQQVMDPENLTWIIVGDLSTIEEDVRSLNYGDLEIWDSYGKKISN